MNKKNLSPSNRITDISGKEWSQMARSWWFQKRLKEDHPDSNIEKQHPSTISFQDVQKFIKLFTKKGMTVLDPFCGVASILKAAALCGRNAIGFEISTKWVKLGKLRLQSEVPARKRNLVDLRIIRGDCLKKLHNITSQSIDYIITNPPSWDVSNNYPSRRAFLDKKKRGTSIKYSRSPSDLGNIKTYDVFLTKMLGVFNQCRRILKRQRFMTVIMNDFYHKDIFYPYHMHIIELGEKTGLSLRGCVIMIERGTPHYSYDSPTDFFQNINHQFALTFQRI